MLFCSKCGSGWAYLPFYGPIECVNSKCENYNSRHFESMKEEIEKKKPTKSMVGEKIRFSYDEEDEDYEQYFLPGMGIFFSDHED